MWLRPYFAFAKMLSSKKINNIQICQYCSSHQRPRFCIFTKWKNSADASITSWIRKAHPNLTSSPKDRSKLGVEVLLPNRDGAAPFLNSKLRFPQFDRSLPVISILGERNVSVVDDKWARDRGLPEFFSSIWHVIAEGSVFHHPAFIGFIFISLWKRTSN